MGRRDFSEPDMRRRLLSRSHGIGTEAPAYIDFFMAQGADISSIWGYSRMLRSQYEIDLTELLISYRTQAFTSISQRITKLTIGQFRMHAGAFSPLQQAATVFTSYDKALSGKGISIQAQDTALYMAAEEAASITAEVYRDAALHQLLTVAGGNTRASEHALMTGASSTLLRKRYGVKLAASNWQLELWHCGLLQLLRELPADPSFIAMQNKLATIEKLVQQQQKNANLIKAQQARLRQLSQQLQQTQRT